MQNVSDAELLREFVSRGNDDAFREIVARHTDLIYSAALRQVNSPDHAADIAQKVFTDLARKAKSVTEKFSADATLAGWLFRSTRFAALNHLRDEQRRRAHERQAMEQLLTNSESAADWSQIRPLLDEAMDALNDDDRDALLLRFFKNQNLREVGEQLKISDDAAQKRVSRAVEKLREFFSKRKITIGASGLAVLISANAVQSAPIGLAAKISAAAIFAGKTISTSTVIAATKTIAMTTLQKTFVVAALTAAIGTGIYQAHQNSQLREQVQNLQQTQNDQLAQLQRERDDATNQLAGLLAENAQLKSNSNEDELLKLRGEVTRLRATQLNSSGENTNDPFTQSVLTLASRAVELNEHLQQMPDKQIPELQLLDANDWLAAAKDAKFDTDADIRRDLQKLRRIAKDKVPIGSALHAYVNANNRQLPSDLSQLKPYFNKSQLGDLGLDDSTFKAIIGRYTLLHTGNANDFPSDTWFVVEKTPVDKDYDSREKFGLGTSESVSTGIGETGDPNDPSYSSY